MQNALQNISSPPARMGKNEREKQILRYLNNNGPLSIWTLCRLLNPPIKYRRLCEVMARLRAKRHISARRKHFSFDPTIYQINQDLNAREKLAQYLGGEAIDFDQRNYRFLNSDTNDAIVFWKEVLNTQLPGAVIFRKHEIRSNSTLNALFDEDDETDNCVPDLLLLTATNKYSTRAIGIHIWTSGYSIHRLTATSKKEFCHSRLSGSLIVARDDNETDFIFRELSARRMLTTLKANFDGIKTFFATSEVQTILTKTMPEVLTLELKKRQLDAWIDYLPHRFKE